MSSDIRMFHDLLSDRVATRLVKLERLYQEVCKLDMVELAEKAPRVFEALQKANTTPIRVRAEHCGLLTECLDIPNQSSVVRRVTKLPACVCGKPLDYAVLAGFWRVQCVACGHTEEPVND